MCALEPLRQPESLYQNPVADAIRDQRRQPRQRLRIPTHQISWFRIRRRESFKYFGGYSVRRDAGLTEFSKSSLCGRIRFRIKLARSANSLLVHPAQKMIL